MLKTIAVDRLRPNPFRRLDEYPILREKVDALKESIDQTGFWGTIVGREAGEDVEIAFGHHRLVALREMAEVQVEVIIRDLSNEDMLRMMARENMEEWCTSAWVEMETIRATITAYGEGKIALPMVSKDTRKDLIRHVAPNGEQRPYTEATVAEFLGLIKKRGEDGRQTNGACLTAFQALDMIDAGFLSEADVKGLKRGQLAELVKEQWSIYKAEMRAAEDNRKEAELAREKAAQAEVPLERQIHEKRARVFTEQAEQHKADAQRKTTRFGKEGADLFREDRGRAAVRSRAAELKSVVSRPLKVHSLDELAERIAKRLDGMAGDETLVGDFKVLKANLIDVSPGAILGLCQSFASLINTLERMQDRLKILPQSHDAGTGNHHEQPRSITDGRR